MRVLAEILKTFGGVLLVFSAVITFKTDLPDELENIIYFRGILLGSLLMIAGSAITTTNIHNQNILYSLAIGELCILIASSFNLIMDNEINLDFYFDLAIGAVILFFIIITTIRLWLVQYRQRLGGGR